MSTGARKGQQVWFVTGAGSGIGAGVARAARKAGHRVVATGRNIEKLRNALADVAGEDVILERLDVTSEAEAKRAVDTAVARFGRIDVLVNNAGYSLLGNFEEFTTEQIERQFAPNFWGVVHVMRAVLPIMIQMFDARCSRGCSDFAATYVRQPGSSSTPSNTSTPPHSETMRYLVPCPQIPRRPSTRDI